MGNYYWYNISVLVFSLIMQLKVASWNIDELYSNIDGMRICNLVTLLLKKLLILMTLFVLLNLIVT